MDFKTVYKQYKWLIELNARKYAKRSGEDVDELISLLNTEIWLIYQNYDSSKGKLETFLNISMQGKVINYLERKNNEFNRNAAPFSSLEENDEDGSERTYDVESEYDIQEHILTRLGEIKTDEDKRQLINVLIQNIDSVTTAIVNEILVNADARPTAIGRKLGIHHQTVRRKLDAIARKYYANHDEDINEYLAV